MIEIMAANMTARSVCLARSTLQRLFSEPTRNIPVPVQYCIELYCPAASVYKNRYYDSHNQTSYRYRTVWLYDPWCVAMR